MDLIKFSSNLNTSTVVKFVLGLKQNNLKTKCNFSLLINIAIQINNS